MDQLRRVAIADTVVLDRVGNAALEPRDTDRERDPAGYLTLLRGAPARLVSEDELLAGYLAGGGPDVSSERAPTEFCANKWLSLVSSHDLTVFADHGRFTRLPHTAGVLQLNPIFELTRHDTDLQLSFRFPSTWYAFENWGTLSYTSAGERLDTAAVAATAHGVPTTEGTDYLQRRFVLLGMPPNYARRSDLQ